jgi:hypothetical protein
METETEMKNILVFKTSTHLFKIDEDKLEELRIKKKYPELIKERVQKGVKQIYDKLMESE